MSKPTTERPTIKRHWLRPLLRRVDFITTTLNSAYAFLGEYVAAPVNLTSNATREPHSA